MANKTMNNSKPQDHAAKAPIQSQLARVKREEEEEVWISGEELYTEGSSDEEECKTQSRSRRRVNNDQSSRASSANPSVDRRGRSPVLNEVRAKSENPGDVVVRKIDEGRFVSKNMPNHRKTSPSSMDSTNSTSKELDRHIREDTMTNPSNNDREDDEKKEVDEKEEEEEEEEEERIEISWKAKRGTIVLPNSSNSNKEEVDKC